MKKEKICAIYARVSTEKQNADHQVDELKIMASQRKCMVFDVYVDKVSGTRDSRPELNRMLFDMRKGLFNCIMIYKLCLLYTSPSPRDQRGSRMPSSA